MTSRTAGFAVLSLFLVNQVYGLNLINRDEWSKRPLPSDVNNLPIPVSNVIIAHTVTGECFSEVIKCPELYEKKEISYAVHNHSCMEIVRSIQNYHVDELGFEDIGYNFLVGGDGTVFEGRGWATIGAHTKGYNKNSIGVAFIGNFNSKAPTPEQLQAAQLLLEEGVTDYLLTRDYRLFGHRQLIAVDSPGHVLFPIIKNWPHWSSSY